jgi:hypothetical protein
MCAWVFLHWSCDVRGFRQDLESWVTRQAMKVGMEIEAVFYRKPRKIDSGVSTKTMPVAADIRLWPVSLLCGSIIDSVVDCETLRTCFGQETGLVPRTLVPLSIQDSSRLPICGIKAFFPLILVVLHVAAEQIDRLRQFLGSKQLDNITMRRTASADHAQRCSEFMEEGL